MNKVAKITAIMITTTLLSNCASTVCPKVSIPVLEPLKVVHFKQGKLNCLEDGMKKIVVDRIKNCEGRIGTLNNQIDALSK